MAGELSCAESEELLALAALGVLNDPDAGSLDAHVARCQHCRQVGREFQRTTAVLPESLQLIEPPKALRRRLLTEVYGSDPRRRRVQVWWRLWQHIPQGRSLTALGAAAAAAAIAFGVWGATRAAQPQELTYSVVGTTSEPQAQGTLTYFPATEDSVVTVTGLPEPQAQGGTPRAYELWLIGSDGAPRPAAFLTQSPSTHAWTAALHGDMSQFVTMAATSEPYGGSPQPTGPQLFSVQLTR